MIGTLINVVLILLGCGLGLVLRKGIPDRLQSTVMQALGLSVILIGITGAIKTTDMMCVIISMAVGGFIGSAINIEKRLEQLGDFAERKLGGAGGEKGSISKGFVTASLVYCVGAMAIVGSIDSGIRGDHATLIAKGILDGVSAIIFTSTMGVGVALSAVAVFVYQGAIALLAQWVAPILTDVMIGEMSAVGGLLILGIGVNMIFDQKVIHISVGNLLPAIFMPLIYLPVAEFLSRLFA